VLGPSFFGGEEEIMYGATASVDFYDCVIAPYKGALEEWYVANKGLYIFYSHWVDSMECSFAKNLGALEAL
jgi:hypothetical protein